MTAARSVRSTVPTAGPGPVRDVVRLARYPEIPDCRDGEPPGPCAHQECRYHLAHREYWDHHLKPSRDCSLDVANEGEHTLEEVAAAFGMSAERVRQIEEASLERLKRNRTLRGLNGKSKR